jgi:hypothetical protein
MARHFATIQNKTTNIQRLSAEHVAELVRLRDFL